MCKVRPIEMPIFVLLVIAAALCLSAPPTAQATPLEGIWDAIPGAIIYSGEPTHALVAHSDASGSSFTLSFDCGTPTPCVARANASEVAVAVYAAGEYSAPAPNRWFLFLHNAACTTRFGSEAFLGMWADRLLRPYTAQCFLPRSARLTVRPGSPPVPMPSIRLPQLRLPPNLQRVAPIPPRYPSPIPAPPPSPK
jgi:hypothetical protein